MDVILDCGRDMLRGVDSRAEHRERAYLALVEDGMSEKDLARARRDADMSMLVLEPLRWTVALRPRWIALEQVPPVLDLWRWMAHELLGLGYSAWAGVLNAADYGVPQTRERAFLMASLDGPVHPPAPTHCKGGAVTLEGELLPWVSMAQALGWGMTARPGYTLTGGGIAAGGAEPIASSGREAMDRERSKVGAWMVAAGRTGEGRPKDATTEPADTLSGKGTAYWIDDPEHWAHEEPAPTVVTTRRSKDGLLVGRQLPPGEGENVGGHNWARDMPATTITSARVRDGDYDGRSAIRVTVQEAAILQGFPADYPWDGSRTKQFQQVGNAVPPPLARAVVRALVHDDTAEMPLAA